MFTERVERFENAIFGISEPESTESKLSGQVKNKDATNPEK